MARLFAEHFVVPAVAPDHEPPEPLYDERRDLNLDAAGRVLVEQAAGGRTDTLTEVDPEAEDRDPDEDIVGFTGTEARRAAERDDFARGELTLGTETKAAGESEDFGRDDVGPETRTGVPREAEDFASEVMLGTDTRIPNEAEDFSDHAAWAGTDTFVRNEAEDFSREMLVTDARPPRERDRA